jgi:hypothetical protein
MPSADGGGCAQCLRLQPCVRLVHRGSQQWSGSHLPSDPNAQPKSTALHPPCRRGRGRRCGRRAAVGVGAGANAGSTQPHQPLSCSAEWGCDVQSCKANSQCQQSTVRVQQLQLHTTTYARARGKSMGASSQQPASAASYWTFALCLILGGSYTTYSCTSRLLRLQAAADRAGGGRGRGLGLQGVGAGIFQAIQQCCI